LSKLWTADSAGIICPIDNPALRQHPNNHGHTLVLPVAHTRNLADAVHVVPRFPDDHFVMTRAAVAEVPRPDRLR
jgi:diadenosine tetraphosphate (Ap4A) HIT family hydrolase